VGHYIELVIEDGAPKVRFRCDYPEDAFCRRWPLDKNVEEWFEDEPLDAGGHQCSTEAWIEDLGIEEGLMGKDQVLASIPVRVGFDDGPVITRVFSLEAQHQATALEAAANDWQWKGWGDTPRNPDIVQDRLGAAAFVAQWLRDRATTIKEGFTQ